MVKEMSTATKSEECVLDSDPNSDPISLEDPPSYEESFYDGWDANLTWPNIANREELAQIFRLNNYDYSTRGRAFTVSGPSEMQAPRYKNIIHYFENSLEDMSSIEWSASSGTHRSALQLQTSKYPSSEAETNLVSTSRNGPKSHNIGTRSSSRDVMHWGYINEINPNTTTRFTVRLVPETDGDPPNYSATDNTASRNGLTEKRPSSTSGTCNTNINNSDTRHCNINKDIEDKSRRPSAPSLEDTSRQPSAPSLEDKSRQPSAPSLDQIDEPDTMIRSESWVTAPLGRIVTAPARLEDELGDSRVAENEETKTVSFFLGDQDSSSNLQKKSKDGKVYNESKYSEYEKKDVRTSETGDSGYGDEASPLSDITPLKPRDTNDHIVTIEIEDSQSKLVPSPRTDDWENHRLFRHEEPKSKLSYKFWGGVTFFVCDIILILTGALLLLLNFEANVIAGFVLLGLGVGMCIPALNYVGGFPTVCAGIQR